MNQPSSIDIKKLFISLLRLERFQEALALVNSLSEEERKKLGAEIKATFGTQTPFVKSA